MAASCSDFHPSSPLDLPGQFNLGSIASIKSRAWSCGFCDLVLTALELDGAQRPHPGYYHCTIEASVSASKVELKSQQRVRLLQADEVHVEYFDGMGEFKGTISRELCEHDPAEERQKRYRPIAAGPVNYSVIQEWRDICRSRHGDCCSAPTWLGLSWPSDLRLIDVKRRAVVHAPEGCVYAALSYVWGAPDSFAHVSTEEDLRCLPYNLLAAHEMPRTIEDAIQVTLGLGLEYLWVDAICIAQEPFLNEDKNHHLAQMDTIFKAAEIVIAAATTSCASQGIFNHESGYRRNFTLQADDGSRWAVEKPDLDAYLKTTAWNRRAWTLQESLLARRLLVIGHHESYWVCQCDQWRETKALEPTNEHHGERPSAAPDTSRPPARVLNLDQTWDTWFQVHVIGTSHTLGAYTKLITAYTERKIGYAHDGINAVRGILSLLHRFDPLRWHHIHWGLPAVFFDLAMLWRPKQSCGRSSAIRWRQEIPSWSWAGWLDEHTSGVYWDLVTFSEKEAIALVPTIKWYLLQADGYSISLEAFERKSHEWQSHKPKGEPGPCGVDRFAQPHEPPFRDDLCITTSGYYLHFLTTVAEFSIGGELPQWIHEEFPRVVPSHPMPPHALYDRDGCFAGSIAMPVLEAQRLRDNGTNLEFIFLSYGRGPEQRVDSIVYKDQADRSKVDMSTWADIIDFLSYDVLNVMYIARGPDGMAERMHLGSILETVWLKSQPKTEWIVLG